MSDTALSPRQFGFASTMKSDARPMPEGSSGVLPLSAATGNSALAVAAWHKPAGQVLPLSKQTQGSTFNPNA